MDNKVNYAAVGLFVIVLTVGAMIVFFWLSGFSQNKNFNRYIVYARGGVTGLNIDSPVLFNGVRVGTVEKIGLDSFNPQFVKLRLKIIEKTPINESTKATLIPQGITGLVYVGLKAETPEAPPLKAEPGQRYPVIPYEKPFLTQITEILPDLTKNISTIAEKVKKVFSDQNIQSITGILIHLNAITGVLDQQSAPIRRSIHSLDIFLGNSAKASRNFEATTAAMKQTAGAMDNAMPSLEELLNRLNDTAVNLEQVSQDLQRNPAVLIRGKQPPPPGPGE